MSRKVQEVSASFASGVNPKLPGAGAAVAASAPHLPSAAFDITEALDAGWLELWYQPKIGTRTQDIRGAEALLRMRHPRWGIIPAARFMPDICDLRFKALSQFVIDRALADWQYFISEDRRLDLSINLPVSFLQEPASFEYLSRQLPDHPAFEGLIVEIPGSELTRDLSLACDFANQARAQKIAVAIDHLGDQWATLAEMRDFPFVEIKVERDLVSGCAVDRSKQRLCRHVVDIANRCGARTVAVGVETRADFLAARDLGFDLIQGFLFAKPMGLRAFLHATADVRPI